MKLDLTPLRNALRQLEKSLGYLNSEMAREDQDIREQFRAATVQAFEFVYELANKFVLRQLEQMVANPANLREIDFMPKMRLAADSGLISDPNLWRGYRELRSRTSHTYDQAQAEAIVEEVKGFLDEARRTLAQLERLNSAD